MPNKRFYILAFFFCLLYFFGWTLFWDQQSDFMHRLENSLPRPLVLALANAVFIFMFSFQFLPTPGNDLPGTYYLIGLCLLHGALLAYALDKTLRLFRRKNKSRP